VVPKLILTTPHNTNALNLPTLTLISARLLLSETQYAGFDPIDGVWKKSLRMGVTTV